jgi:hypothetical protein
VIAFSADNDPFVSLKDGRRKLASWDSELSFLYVFMSELLENLFDGTPHDSGLPTNESLYPEKLLVSVPAGTRGALRQASREQHLTTSAYLRQVIRVALQVDGVTQLETQHDR